MSLLSPRGRTTPLCRPVSGLRRRLLRVSTAVLASGTAIFLVPAAASAHVHVSPDTTVAGSYATLTFRVPTESATASTTKIEVTLPTDDPFASVSARPLAGWTVSITDAKLPKPVRDDDGATLTKAPHTVTWTADGDAAIKPGEFQEFDLSVGPLPGSGTVTLPATQTYSDGSVVKWDESMAAGAAEPEHPAPSFDVTPASGATASPAASVGSTTPTVTTNQARVRTSDTTARSLAIVGIVIGVIGAALGAVGIANGRKRPTQ